MTTYTSQVIVDPETGEYVINIPEELTNELGWEIGDTLAWEVDELYQVTLKKVNKMTTYAVETISTFRHVYFVECESEEDALDVVTAEESENSFQKYLGQQIVSSREVSKKEMIKIINETEQPGLTEEEFDRKPWIKNCVYKVDYTK